MDSSRSEIRVTIPGRLSGLNEHDYENRRGKQAGARHKREQQQIVEYCILAAGAPKVPAAWYPLSVTFRWREKDRMRDPDNIAFAKKYILDALQKMRTIQGDGWRHICSLADDFDIDKEHPHIEVIIRPGGWAKMQLL